MDSYIHCLRSAPEVSEGLDAGTTMLLQTNKPNKHKVHTEWTDTQVYLL